MSRQSKTNDYAYAAGIIDGEGCIQIKKHNAESGAVYSLVVLVNMCDGESLDYLFGRFGGHVYHTKNYNESFRLPVYRWEITSTKAAWFLKRILPFLRIKKQQAQLALSFQSRVITRYIGISEAERTIRETMYLEMRQLKEIHNSSRAAATTKFNDASIDIEAKL